MEWWPGYTNAWKILLDTMTSYIFWSNAESRSLVPRVKQYLGDLPWMRGSEELLWGLTKLLDL